MIQTTQPLSGYRDMEGFQGASLLHVGKLLSICPVPKSVGYPFDQGSERLQEISKTEADLCKVDGLRDICLNNLGIPRNKMPQLNATVLASYVQAKNAQGILVDSTSYRPSDLEPVQSEISLRYISDMIRNYYAGIYDPCRDPILVADPSRVVDGHHRLVACNLLGRSIDAIHVHDRIGKVLRELRHFFGVEFFEL